MQIDNLILNSLRNQGQNNSSNSNNNNNGMDNGQVLGTMGSQNMNQQFVNLSNFGVNCCPPSNGQVLGAADRRIEVPEVLGIGQGNTFVEVCIPVIPPGLNILFDLIQKQVFFDAVVPANGKVFINGRLLKIIPFTVCNPNATPQALNTNGVVVTNIVAVTAQVPFSLCIPVKGAERGMRAVVLSFRVDEVDLPNLRCPDQQCIRSIVEKDCIEVEVKVERDTIISVPTTGNGV